MEESALAAEYTDSTSAQRYNSPSDVLGYDKKQSDDPIYPTPPLGQDMTQGQFFKRGLAGLNSEFPFS